MSLDNACAEDRSPRPSQGLPGPRWLAHGGPCFQQISILIWLLNPAFGFYLFPFFFFFPGQHTAESTWKLFVLCPGSKQGSVDAFTQSQLSLNSLPNPMQPPGELLLCPRIKAFLFLREWDGGRAPLLLDVPPNLESHLTSGSDPQSLPCSQAQLGAFSSESLFHP